MDDVRWYPSPHNTQPIKVKIINPNKADVYYDLPYALPEGDPPARFAWSTVGIFTEALKIAAAAQGLKVTTKYMPQNLPTHTLNGLQKVATCSLSALKGKNDELPAELLRLRRTNRLDYDGRKLGEKVIKEVKKEAQKFGHTFEIRSDQTSVDWVNKLNVRMVFYDLSDHKVRNELAGWSRYTSRQAKETQDGLSADCLHVPGLGLRLFMKHYWATKIPGIGSFLKWLYKRNIQNIPTIGWLEGPFFNPEQYIQSGRLLLRVWLIMTKYGVAYQPYGSVITNQRAHEEFRDHFSIDETDQMAWLLMRLGYSKAEPPRSYRRSIDDMLVKE